METVSKIMRADTSRFQAERSAVFRGSHEDLSPEARIGNGSFGAVYVCKSKKRKEQVAVKVIHKRVFGVVKQFMEREIQNHKALRHPHIVTYYMDFNTEQYHCIAMEYLSGGTLLRRVLSRKCESEDWARWYFQQVIFAVDFCHKKGVVVRDIKLENMLLDKDQRILKLCDFGFSKDNRRHGAPHTQVGTPLYIAPEVMRQTKVDYDGQKVDVWACGICLFIMLYGRHPFVEPKMQRSMGMRQLFHSIINDPVVIPEQQQRSGQRIFDITAECRDLLRMMLQKEPENRATLDCILDNEWFTKNLPSGTKDYNKELLAMA